MDFGKDMADKENALRIPNKCIQKFGTAKIKTPSKSPFKVNGDRFVPSRVGIDWSLKSGIYNDLWSTPKKKRARLTEQGVGHELRQHASPSTTNAMGRPFSASTPRRAPETSRARLSTSTPTAITTLSGIGADAASSSVTRRRIDFGTPESTGTAAPDGRDRPLDLGGMGRLTRRRRCSRPFFGAGPGTPSGNLGPNGTAFVVTPTTSTTYDKVLGNELLGTGVDTHHHERFTVVTKARGGLGEKRDWGVVGGAPGGRSQVVPMVKGLGCDGRRGPPVRKLFNFTTKNESAIQVSPFSISALSIDTENLLKSPRKTPRKIPKVPYKVLDAPDLQDDFYLNLVDWSSRNTLAVGLGSCVYLWSAYTSQVTKLCDLNLDNDTVTSLSWADESHRAHYLALGTHKGNIQVWDTSCHKKILDLLGHTGRVSVSAWNSDLICSGSRDRSILQFDIRQEGTAYQRQLSGHRQEVCGMKWAPEKNYLASGGNDNKLLLWDIRSSIHPVQEYLEHTAAVKAITWCPHQRGLLVSGGGTVDRCIRFWNTTTSRSDSVQSIDTGSQVCNLAWSKNSNEFVSTHGYSQNQIVIWKYPSLSQIATLTGHSYRVLYLAVSPDGESIVTGAGDETLRFWNVFSKPANYKMPVSSLNLFTHIR